MTSNTVRDDQTSDALPSNFVIVCPDEGADVVKKGAQQFVQ